LPDALQGQVSASSATTSPSVSASSIHPQAIPPGQFQSHSAVTPDSSVSAAIAAPPAVPGVVPTAVPGMVQSAATTVPSAVPGAVPSAVPVQQLPAGVAAADHSALSIDLGSWKQTLSHFGTTSEPRMAVPVKLLQEEKMPEGYVRPPVAETGQLRLEWSRFLEHLAKKGLQVLVTHLHSCELLACSPTGLVELGCCRKFSFEELLHSSVLLEKEIAEFYGISLSLQIRYDAARDACTKEKSIFTLFRELSEQNEVVRFLISEFGGELVY